MKFFDSLKLNLPFQYIWSLKTSIGINKTILDLGCGDGSLMELLSRGEKWQITGVDIYQKYLQRARKRKIYKKLIRGNVLRIVTQNKLHIKFDAVFFSHVLEHLNKKEGKQVIDKIESLAKKRIVIALPRGFMEQPHEFLDENPHQVHKSGWDIEEFTSRGYRVVGVGFWPIWSYNGLGRNANLFRKIIANAISYLMSPIVYFIPTLGSGIIAVKEKR